MHECVRPYRITWGAIDTQVVLCELLIVLHVVLVLRPESAWYAREQVVVVVVVMMVTLVVALVVAVAVVQ